LKVQHTQKSIMLQGKSIFRYRFSIAQYRRTNYGSNVTGTSTLCL